MYTQHHKVSVCFRAFPYSICAPRGMGKWTFVSQSLCDSIAESPVAKTIELAASRNDEVCVHMWITFVSYARGMHCIALLRIVFVGSLELYRYTKWAGTETMHPASGRSWFWKRDELSRQHRQTVCECWHDHHQANGRRHVIRYDNEMRVVNALHRRVASYKERKKNKERKKEQLKSNVIKRHVQPSLAFMLISPVQVAIKISLYFWLLSVLRGGNVARNNMINAP